VKGNIRLKFGNRLKTLRKRHKITQEKLAALSDVDYKHIQLLESKNPPAIRIDTLEKIANAFNLSCAELLDFND